MDYSDLASVEAALVSAAQADDAGEQASAPTPAPVAPEGQTAPVQPQAQPEPAQAPAAPVDTPAPAAPALADLWDGTPVNPDQLIAEHPELAPLVKQLQGAWTQKTQGLAEERRQFSALGSPEEVQQAVELYTRISNPTNWPQLHSDLSNLMEQYGMSPAQAAAEAATAIQEAVEAGPELPVVDTDDPELGPLVQAIKQQQQELASLRQERESERADAAEREKAERLQAALEGEVQRQHNAILHANPSYGDGDMDAIYELAAFYGGNLHQAQQRYENLRAEWVSRYVESKQSAATAQGVHPAPAAAPLATPATKHETVKAASDEIEEYMRQLQAAGQLGEL